LRKTVSFIVASAITIAGAWLLFQQLFRSPILKGWIVMGSCMALVIGVIWLWTDFVAPMLRKQENG